MKRLYHEPEYRRRIRTKTIQDQESAEKKDREAAEERRIEHLTSAIDRAREELVRSGDEYRAHKDIEHRWHKAEVFGLWAAAIVGTAAIWFGTNDSYEQRGVMIEQRRIMEGQLDQMKGNSLDTKATINLTSSSQRAWIAPTAAVLNESLSTEKGAISATIFYRNSGQQPAFGVVFNKDPWAIGNAAGERIRDPNRPTLLGPPDITNISPNSSCKDNEVSAQGPVVYPSATENHSFVRFTIFVDKERPGSMASFLNGSKIFYYNACFSYLWGGQIRHSAFCNYLLVEPGAEGKFLDCPSGHWAD